MSNGLDVTLRKDPNEWSPESGDRYLDIAFGDSEWGSFFFDTLMTAEAKYVDREPIDDFVVRQETTFQDSLPDFPLLGRIHAFYQDAYFNADEIPSLLAELKRTESLPGDGHAKAFISGMVDGCEAAISDRTGIWLSSS